jgi:hypothetical protein
MSGKSSSGTAKNVIILVLALALVGCGVWYFFIREKSLEEKVEDTADKVGRSISDAVRSVTR